MLKRMLHTSPHCCECYWNTGVVELHRELCTHTTLDLPPTFVFDYPTADDMAAYISQQLAGLAASSITQPPEPIPAEPVIQPAGAAGVSATEAAAGPAWVSMATDERRVLVSQQVAMVHKS